MGGGLSDFGGLVCVGSSCGAADDAGAGASGGGEGACASSFEVDEDSSAKEAPSESWALARAATVSTAVRPPITATTRVGYFEIVDLRLLGFTEPSLAYFDGHSDLGSSLFHRSSQTDSQLAVPVAAATHCPLAQTAAAGKTQAMAGQAIAADVGTVLLPCRLVGFTLRFGVIGVAAQMAQ